MTEQQETSGSTPESEQERLRRVASPAAAPDMDGDDDVVEGHIYVQDPEADDGRHRSN